MSSSNSVLITAIEEATYGVTPATGPFKTARYVSESLSGTPQTAKSTEIHADRTSSGQVQVGLDVAGDINEELSADSLQQDFIRAAMMRKKPEAAAVMTGKAVTVKAIDKTFSVEGAANIAKGDLLFMSGFKDEKNNGMAYVSKTESVEVSPAVPQGKAVIITATPSTGTELAWTFAAAGVVSGTWSYGEGSPDTAGAFTYSAAGTYSVKFTDANGVASHLSLNVVALADTPVKQVSTEEVAYKPIITATPSTDTDLVFSFALDNPTAGTFAFGEGAPATIEAGASASFTFSAAGTYAVTFTNAAGDQSTLSLTVAVAFAENVTQTGTQEESQPAELAVNKFTITVGKETIADETSATTASVTKAANFEIGSDLVSFSMCKHFTELDEKSIDYLGMLVNSMEIDMQHGAIATVNFGFMGNGYDNSADSLLTDGHIIEPASTVQPLNATSDISGVFIDGKIADFCLQSLKINLTNGLTPQVCLGRLAPRTYALGTAAVEISGSAYIADANWNLLEKKLTQQPVSIAFAAENQDGGIAVVVHGAQLSFVDPSASGMDQQVSIDFSGSATNTENGYLDLYYW